jgi:hypothetical protein
VALWGVQAIKRTFNVDARWGHALWRYYATFALERLPHMDLVFYDAHAKFKPDFKEAFEGRATFMATDRPRTALDHSTKQDLPGSNLLANSFLFMQPPSAGTPSQHVRQKFGVQVQKLARVVTRKERDFPDTPTQMTADLEFLQRQEPSLFGKKQIAFGHNGGASSNLSFRTVQLNCTLLFLRQQLEVLLAFHRPGGLSSYNDVEHVQGSITCATAGNVIPSAAFGPADNAADEARNREFAHQQLNAAINTGSFSGQALKSYMYLANRARLHSVPLPVLPLQPAGGAEQLQRQPAGAGLLQQRVGGAEQLQQQPAGAGLLQQRAGGAEQVQQQPAGAGLLQQRAGGAKQLQQQPGGTGLLQQRAGGAQQRQQLERPPHSFGSIDWGEFYSYSALHAFASLKADNMAGQQQVVAAGSITANQLQMFQYAAWFLRTHGKVRYCSVQLLRFGCQLQHGTPCEVCQGYGHQQQTPGCAACDAAGHGCGWSGPPMLQFLPQPYPNNWRYKVCGDPNYLADAAAGRVPVIERPTEPH